jgi:hypothetical protein
MRVWVRRVERIKTGAWCLCNNAIVPIKKCQKTVLLQLIIKINGFCQQVYTILFQ